MKNMKKAIILCSGGLDSVVTANYVRKNLNFDNIAILFFNYNQKTVNQERKASKKCAKEIGADFQEINLNWLGRISGSLINKNGKVKNLNRKELKDTSKESKKYYVPCRNTVFLVYALALAESLYVKNKQESIIFVGFKCEGKESYPDTTKSFVREINKLSKIGCSHKFNVEAPLINKDKEDIVLLGKKLGVNFKETYSCYVGGPNNKEREAHCGKCLACMLRKEGFYWANVKDPTIYIK